MFYSWKTFYLKFKNSLNFTFSRKMVLQRTELEKHYTVAPSQPDLNPVDYKVWGCMQEMVYKTKVRGVEHLRKRIMQVWNDLNQRIICSALREWRKRLRACVEAKSGQFEYKL